MASVNVSRKTFTDAQKDEWRAETANRKSYALAFTDGTTMTGSNVTSDGFSLTESLSSGNNIDFSHVEVPELSFTLINLDGDIAAMAGKQFTLTATAGGMEMPMGTWIVKEASVSNDGKYVIKAQGLLSKFSADVTYWWTNTVTVPITLRDLLISLCDQIGIDYDLPDTFCNSTMSIAQKGITGDGAAISGTEMLGYIQEAAAQFFTMPRLIGNGAVLVPSSLYDTDIVETYTGHLHTGNVDISDYQTQTIDKVQIRSTDNDIGGIAGTGSNTYIIQANPLFYIFGAADLETYAKNVLMQIQKIRYTPIDANLKGLPYVEPGDTIKITTPDGHEATTLMLGRTMNGAQDYTDDVKAQGTQNRQQITTRNGQLKIINQKMHEIVNNVETMKSTITEVQQGVQTNTTKIEQTANKVDIAVAQNGYSNLLLNSNFTDPQDYFKYWKTYGAGATTTEYVADSDFPDGHALKITKTGTVDDPVLQDVNYDANINGKYVNLYLSGKIVDAGAQGNRLTIAFFIRYEDGTSSYTTVQSSELTVGKYYKFHFYKQIIENKKVTLIAPRVFYASPGNTQTVEINNVMMFVADEKTPAPFGTWTDKNNNDLISQINLAPEGVKISGSKVEIETTEFTFGKKPSIVTMKTNTAHTGVSFSGTGTVDFSTKGKYSVINLNADSGTTGSQMYMFNSGEQNTLVIDNYNGTKSGNRLQMVGGDSSWGNYMRLRNSDYSSGKFANVLYWFSNTNSYNAFYLENYEANSNQKIANRVLLRSETNGNSLQLQNYQHGTGTVVNSMITMSDTITYVCQNWHDFQFRGNDRRFRVGGYDGFSGDVTVKDWSGSKNVKLVFHYGIMTGWYYV